MVGCQVLALVILVRIQAPEQIDEIVLNMLFNIL